MAQPSLGLRIARTRLLLPVALLLSSCTPGLPPPVGEPVADPQGLAASLQRASTPAAPQQATFDWTLDEAGSRVRGRGAVRYVAPERLRLDLFGTRGETYLAAALVGENLRVPPAATQQGVPLPSPSLLWAALGVVRPPTGSPLISATMADSVALLRYELASGEFLDYRAISAGDRVRLQQVERRGRRGVLETLTLEYDSEARLLRTRYRDWAAYRDLVFERDTIVDVESFPDQIWRPDGTDD